MIDIGLWVLTSSRSIFNLSYLALILWQFRLRILTLPLYTDTDTDNSLFGQFNDKSNSQCSTFRINTNSFNVERYGDHIKTYIYVDIT